MNRVFLLALVTMNLAGEVSLYQPPVQVPATGIGFRGDGSGVYPGEKPPTSFDESAGTNIRWKTPLPNWGYACPVPVGNRVLFMVEPGCEGIIWPELHCFDAGSGALVWKTEIDPLLAFPELPAATKAEVRAAVEGLYEHGRTAYRICSPLLAIGGVKPDHPEMIKVNDELVKHGMSMESYTPGYGLLRKLKQTDDRRKKWAATWKSFQIKPECTWQGFGSARVGLAFPTPVSDGKRVFVMTYHGTLACVDLASGTTLWSAASGYKGHHGLLASPRVHDGMVIAGWFDTGAFDPLLQAYDQNTGKKVWEAKLPFGRIPGTGNERSGRPGGSPLIMDLKGTPIVLCSTGNVVRAKDGFVYETKIGPTSINTWAVDEATDAIFFQTGGDNNPGQRVCLELSVAADALTVKERWAHKGWNEFASSVFTEDRLLTDRVHIDPATGLLLGHVTADADWRKTAQNAPVTNHVLLVANGHAYGYREEKFRTAKDQPEQRRGVVEVFTVDGKKVSSNILAAVKREGAVLDRFRMQGWGDTTFSYCCAMNIGGDSLFLASDDLLYCVSAP